MNAKLYRVRVEGELHGTRWGLDQLITEAEADAGFLPLIIERMIHDLPHDSDRLQGTWTCEPVDLR